MAVPNTLSLHKTFVAPAGITIGLSSAKIGVEIIDITTKIVEKITCKNLLVCVCVCVCRFLRVSAC